MDVLANCIINKVESTKISPQATGQATSAGSPALASANRWRGRVGPERTCDTAIHYSGFRNTFVSRVSSSSTSILNSITQVVLAHLRHVGIGLAVHLQRCGPVRPQLCQRAQLRIKQTSNCFAGCDHSRHGLLGAVPAQHSWESQVNLETACQGWLTLKAVRRL